MHVAVTNVADGGTVNILSGDYRPQLRITNEKSVHFRVVDSQDANPNPGVMVFGPHLIGNDKAKVGREYLFDSGTFKLTKNAGGSIFYDSKLGSAYGVKSDNVSVFSGADTVLDATSASTIYFGWSLQGGKVTFKDGARGLWNGCYYASINYGNFSRLTIQDGAAVTNSGLLYIGCAVQSCGKVSDVVVTVDNAILRATSTTKIGDPQGYKLSGSKTGELVPTEDIHLVLKGERPFFHSASVRVVNKSNDFEIDVSEMPLAGYAAATYDAGKTTKAALYCTSFTLVDGGALKVTGLDELQTRLTAAGTKYGKWLLIQSTGSKLDDLSNDYLETINAAWRADGKGNFWLENISGKIYLNCAPTVAYVVPDNTPNTPAEPYDSWETASHILSNATVCVAPYGVIKMIEGKYVGNRPSPEYAVRIQIQKSQTDDSVGVATITNGTIIMGTKTAIDSPFHHHFIIEKGTYKIDVPTSSNAFAEYPVSGSGAEAYNKLTVTGPNAYLDCTGKTLYLAFISKYPTITFSNGARGKSSEMQMGTASSTDYGTLIIENGAMLTNTSSASIAKAANRNTVRVDGGEWYTPASMVYGGDLDSDQKTYRVTTGNSIEILNGGKLILSGSSVFKPFTSRTTDSRILFDDSDFAFAANGIDIDRPGTNNTLIVRNGSTFATKYLKYGDTITKDADFVTEIDNAAVTLTEDLVQRGDATLKLNVENVALDGTAPTFLTASSATVGEGGNIEIAGATELRERMTEAEVESLSVTLINTTNGITLPEGTTISLPAGTPADVKLVQTANSLKLKLGKPNGFTVIVQ